MFWDWREQAAEKKVKSEARHSNRIKICSVDVAKIITIYCFCSSSSFFHEKRQKYNMRRSNFCLLFFQLKTMIYNTGIRRNEKKTYGQCTGATSVYLYFFFFASFAIFCSIGTALFPFFLLHFFPCSLFGIDFCAIFLHSIDFDQFQPFSCFRCCYCWCRRLF